MIGEYPLLIDGKKSGKLIVRQSGIKFVFEAFCAHMDEVIRLSVFGADRAGYLGVMQPHKNGLRLYREFSKSELTGFPQSIEYAANTRIEKKTQEEKNSDDIFWRRNSVGLLFAVHGGQKICAIPKKLGIAAYGKELAQREIDGEMHRVFMLKNGKN